MIRSLVFFFVVADARWMERRTQHYCQHKSSLWTKDLCRRVFVFSFFYCCSFRSTFCMAFVGKYSHQTMCNTKSIEGSEIIVNYILFLTFRIRIMNAFSIHLKNRRRKKKATTLCLLLLLFVFCAKFHIYFFLHLFFVAFIEFFLSSFSIITFVFAFHLTFFFRSHIFVQWTTEKKWFYHCRVPCVSHELTIQYLLYLPVQNGCLCMFKWIKQWYFSIVSSSLFFSMSIHHSWDPPILFSFALLSSPHYLLLYICSKVLSIDIWL